MDVCLKFSNLTRNLAVACGHPPPAGLLESASAPDLTTVKLQFDWQDEFQQKDFLIPPNRTAEPRNPRHLDGIEGRRNSRSYTYT